MSKNPGFFKRLGFAFRVAWRPQTIKELDQWIETAMYGSPAASGAQVSGATAVNFTAFYSGVSQICQTIASCKTYLYRQGLDAGTTKWAAHPLYRALILRPNPQMDAYRWKERMQYHAMVWGNGYSYRERDGAGRIARLWLLNPERTWPEVEENGMVVYIHRDSNNEERRFSPNEIFHLAGFGFDGVAGYSLLKIHRDAIGLGLDQQEFTGRFIRNGTHLGGVLQHPENISDQAQKRLKETWPAEYGGAGRAGSTAILEEGMTYQKLGMPLEDAQFLESKVFQVQEMARILNLSPYKLKDYSHATFSNIEHLGIEYATDTIRPWAERWEAAIDTQLLNEREQMRAFAQFDLDSIQRGDTKTMREADAIDRNAGILNADEIRQKRGMNPIGGQAGAVYWMPKNMTDAENPETAEQPVIEEGVAE